MREIIVTIDEKGNSEIEVRGVQGPSCTALTKEVEDAIGKVTGRRLTREYHLTPAGQQIKAGGKA